MLQVWQIQHQEENWTSQSVQIIALLKLSSITALNYF